MLATGEIRGTSKKIGSMLGDGERLRLLLCRGCPYRTVANDELAQQERRNPASCPARSAVLVIVVHQEAQRDAGVEEVALPMLPRYFARKSDLPRGWLPTRRSCPPFRAIVHAGHEDAVTSGVSLALHAAVLPQTADGGLLIMNPACALYRRPTRRRGLTRGGHRIVRSRCQFTQCRTWHAKPCSSQPPRPGPFTCAGVYLTWATWDQQTARKPP